jgi:hypothetical protein
MSVISVTRIDGSDSSWNRLWQRKYTLAFRVECSSRYDGPVTIRASTNGVRQPTLPIIGNSYYVTSTEKDLGSFAEEINYRLESASANPDHAVWNVTVNYGPYDANTFPENPIDWPIVAWFGSQNFERIAWKDRNGDPIKNSANSAFSEPVTVDDNRSLLYVTRNELVSTYDYDLAATYRNSVNDAVWNGFATRTVKCVSIDTGEPQYNSVAGVRYYAVKYVFDINLDTWDKVLLDQGYTDISLLDSTKRLTIRDSNGQPLTEAALLNGSGHRLAANGTPVFLTFRVASELDFAVFNLDLATALGRT